MPDRREYAGRTAMLLLGVLAALVVLATAAAIAGARSGAARGAPEPEASPKEHPTMDPAPVTGTTALRCGQPFRRPAGGGLTLTGRFPTTAPAGERAVSGTVEVTSAAALRGVVTPYADVFLVRDGRVETTPLPQDAMGVRWDLVPGKSERLPGEATLVSCEPGGGSVRPGTYELYARVVVIPDDGAAVAVYGGPWTLEVR
jgi:hypothetical protein